MNPTSAQSLADANRSQLIVIDVQSRLLPVMHEPDRLLKHCNTLIQAAQLLNIPVTVTEQYPKGIGHTEPELVRSLGSSYHPVEKTCFSCCGADNFNSRINQFPDRNQLIISGIEAHVCVLQTTMELLSQQGDPAKEIFVVSDAISSREKKNKKIALNRLNQAGAVITCTESVLFEWLKDSSHDHFKALSSLIK